MAATVNVNGYSAITTNKAHIGNGSPNGTMNLHDYGNMTVNGWFNVGVGSGSGTINMDGYSKIDVTNATAGATGWHGIGVSNGSATINMAGHSQLTISASDYWATMVAASQWDENNTARAAINLSENATMTQNPGWLLGQFGAATAGTKSCLATINVSGSATLSLGFLDLGNGPDTDNYQFWRDDTNDSVDNATYHGPYSQHAGGTLTVRNSGTATVTGGDLNVGLWGANSKLSLIGDDPASPATVSVSGGLHVGRGTSNQGGVTDLGGSLTTSATVC